MFPVFSFQEVNEYISDYVLKKKLLNPIFPSS